MEGKEINIIENNEKSLFSLLLLGWRENGEKKNKKVSFFCLVKEKSEEKENIIIINDLFTLNLI